MKKYPIYTTGDGQHKQYARRDDGVLFYRARVKWSWGKWRININQHPTGLYPINKHAILPTQNISLPDVWR